MTEGQKALDAATTEAQSLQKLFAKLKAIQVTSGEYKQIAKATALAWFNDHRTRLIKQLGEDEVAPLDNLYREVISASARATKRTKYIDLTKAIKKALGTLQTKHAVPLSKNPSGSNPFTPDTPPSFASLVADTKMQGILEKRWNECSICVTSKAPLAATVMMGGLLEGLLLAKINQTADKTKIFGAASAPKERATNKPLPLKDWGLKNFIDVAHELGWITKTTKDIGEVVRDYRNYIHPQKELSHGVTLEAGDAKMLWEVAKSITVQLLKP